MRGDARRIPALMRRGGRSPVVMGGGGGVAPTITTPPAASWTVVIGNSPTLTDPIYTGDIGTITWTLYRDGVADGTIADVSKATAEAYTAVAADIGPDLYFESTVTNGSGSDSDVSNTVVFDDATYLPDTAIWVSTAGLTLADSDTTVDSWAASLGGLSGTLTAPTASQRPAYSATGGAGSRPLLTADGSSDCLSGTVTRGSGWASMMVGVVGTITWTTGASPCSNTAGGSTNNLRIDTIDATTIRSIDAGGSPTAIYAGGYSGAAFWSGDADSADGSINMRSGGTVLATSTGAVSAYADGGTFTFAARTSTGGAPCSLAAQAAVTGLKLTADQRTHLSALLTYHTGVPS